MCERTLMDSASCTIQKYPQCSLHKILKIGWENRRTNVNVLKEANIPTITKTIIRHQLRWRTM